MRLTGICATDLELVRGYYPFTGVAGHEFVGEVVQASADARLPRQSNPAACGQGTVGRP